MAPDPSVSWPGKSVNKWSGEVSPLNVIFTLEKFMQNMADTIFVQASYITLLCRVSYLEHLKPGLKALRNNPLHHADLFPDMVIVKAEEDIAKTEADLHSP